MINFFINVFLPIFGIICIVRNYSKISEYWTLVLCENVCETLGCFGKHVDMSKGFKGEA